MLASVAGISHYICQIIEHNDHSNFYLVLDPCVGGSLLKHIKQSGRGGLHISVVRGYVSELVSALSAMEKIQCIHRDIKTSNCVLDHNGRLKLCDFGSARGLSPPSRPATASLSSPAADSNNLSMSIDRPASSSSRAYTIIGTPHAMAPEMVAADAGYDCSVDFWALGVLLYELLTSGIPPWERELLPSRPSTSNSSSRSSGSISASRTWPDQNAQIIARTALHLNTPDDHNSDTALARRAWCISTVDPSFASNTASTTCITTSTATTTATTSSTHQLTDEECHSSAVSLCLALLTIDPRQRHANLTAAQTNLKSTGLPSHRYWSSAVRSRAFFGGVDWEAVDSGRSPPAHPGFDRRLGCMELLAEFDDPADVVSDADQALFADF